MSRARILTAVAVALLLGSCKKNPPLTPVVEDGSIYVLRSVKAQTVPAIALSNAFLTAKILADTVTLRSDGTGSLFVLVQNTNAGQAPDAPIAYTTGFRYTLSGTRLEISLNCPPLALCTPAPHYVGELLPTGIRFDRASEYLVPMVFERLK